MTDVVGERLERLLDAARRLADPRTPEGTEARRVLPASTGLSPEGVDFALGRCLEQSASESELRELRASVAGAPRAWVVLSAGVFTAALRAVALGVATGGEVLVKPSRRDPEMASLLRAITGELFQIVKDVRPASGDHVFAYGRDETLAALGAALPAGVVFHGHGAGIGVAIVELGDPMAALAESIALDVVPFDQRGCASPRVVLCRGMAVAVEAFAQDLALALTRWEGRVPRGELTERELAECVRYRDTARYLGGAFEAGRGVVGFDTESEQALVAPVGRNVHVVRAADPAAALAPLEPLLVAVGVSSATLQYEFVGALPRARFSPLGRMQSPPLDGPMDRR